VSNSPISAFNPETPILSNCLFCRYHRFNRYKRERREEHFPISVSRAICYLFAMAERAKRFQRAVVLFALILLIFLITAIALSFLPQDLSDLKGRENAPDETEAPRNLDKVLKNAVEQELAVTLSEEEINRWLATQIKGNQGGSLSNFVTYKGSWVRLKEGSLDLIFEREVFNRPHTIAMNVEIEQITESDDSMNSQIHWRGGRLGQMPVMQGYLMLVMSSYRELADTMKPEVSALTKLLKGRAKVSISEDKISFAPRSSANSL
jgi:hypothetical protein